MAALIDAQSAVHPAKIRRLATSAVRSMQANKNPIVLRMNNKNGVQGSVVEPSNAISMELWGITGIIFDDMSCTPTGYGTDAGIGYFQCSILGSDDCSANWGFVKQDNGDTLGFYVTCDKPASDSKGTPLNVKFWSDSSCRNSPLNLLNAASLTAPNAECMSPVSVTGIAQPKSISLTGGAVDIGASVGLGEGDVSLGGWRTRCHFRCL